MLPIKSGDVVVLDNKKYVVSSIDMTADGPILMMNEVSERAKFVHASEVNLLDRSEHRRRTKYIQVDYTED